jgi:DNA mismatch repair ATPase MutS
MITSRIFIFLSVSSQLNIHKQLVKTSSRTILILSSFISFLKLQTEATQKGSNNLILNVRSTYSIKDGPFTQNLRYGIAIAELCAFPRQIIADANAICDQLIEWGSQHNDPIDDD